MAEKLSKAADPVAEMVQFFTVGQIQWDGRPVCEKCWLPYLKRAKVECRPKLAIIECTRCGKKTRFEQED